MRGAIAAAWLLTGAFGATVVYAQGAVPEDEDVPGAEPEVVMPAFPGDERLVEFKLDRPTGNRYYVDPGSISVTAEGVVRYTLVVVSGGGARNVSYEGLRCGTRERRLYATGRADRTWAPARRSEWHPVMVDGHNRYQALLARQYFCPNLSPLRTPEEGVSALRRGGHPDAAIGQQPY